jgi:hypothetical protein
MNESKALENARDDWRTMAVTAVNNNLAKKNNYPLSIEPNPATYSRFARAIESDHEIG